MVDGPFFTIITVSYNPGEKLTNTMRSLLSQDCQDYEWIIKDGLSLDGTAQILKPSGHENRKIKFIACRDKGIYDAMNQALAYARGRYYYFLNCGDLFFSKNTLRRVKKYINNTQDCVFCGNVLHLKLGTIFYPPYGTSNFSMYRSFFHQSCFYPASAFRVRAYENSYRIRADQEHFFYCVINNKIPLVRLPFCVSCYEGGGFSEDPQNARLSRQELHEISVKYFGKKATHGYELFMFLTLQRLRKQLSNSRTFSKAYHAIRQALKQ